MLLVVLLLLRALWHPLTTVGRLDGPVHDARVHLLHSRRRQHAAQLMVHDPLQVLSKQVLFVPLRARGAALGQRRSNIAVAAAAVHDLTAVYTATGLSHAAIGHGYNGGTGHAQGVQKHWRLRLPGQRCSV